jgi:hypothetical protein
MAHPLRRASAILQHAASAWRPPRLRRAYIALNEMRYLGLAARASRVVGMLLEQLPICGRRSQPSNSHRCFTDGEPA